MKKLFFTLTLIVLSTFISYSQDLSNPMPKRFWIISKPLKIVIPQLILIYLSNKDDADSKSTKFGSNNVIRIIIGIKAKIKNTNLFFVINISIKINIVRDI